MPATSKSQQAAAAIALSAKRGETPVSKLWGAAKEMYDSMSEKELEDFASTKTKNLPNKVEEEIKKIIREELKILKEVGRYHRLYEPKAKRTLTKVSRDLASFTRSVIENDNDFKMDDFDQMIKEMQFIRSKVESFRTED